LVRGGSGVAVGWLGSKMALVTNTVDVNTVRLDELDNADGTSGLGTIVLNVVVIVYSSLAKIVTSKSFDTYRIKEPWEHTSLPT
jgi:hypothetical protein